MKKSQSIFLLSGLVPLVAAPIAIVASCSSDTPATTTFSLKTNVTLTGLTDEQKDPSQYAGASADTKKKLADLIVAKKDQVFNNPPADLKAEQIQITNDVTANTSDGSLTFKLKVVSTATPPTDLIGETDVTLKGFTATQTPSVTKYTIAFANNKSHAFGDATKPSNDPTFNNDWVLNKVIEKKADIFTASLGSLPAEDQFWRDNLSIEGNLTQENQILKFTLKLTNASTADGATPQQQTITAEITFTGFKTN